MAHQQLMGALNFSAHGFRWRVRTLADEAFPFASAPQATLVTGLYFESDDADPRFLPYNAELLPNESQLAALPMEELAQLLSWAKSVR